MSTGTKSHDAALTGGWAGFRMNLGQNRKSAEAKSIDAQPAQAVAPDLDTLIQMTGFSEEDLAAARRDSLRRAARMMARTETSDAVVAALAQSGQSFRDIQAETGLDKGFLSRLAKGGGKQGPTVTSLALIALALGKTLHISIE